VGYVAKAAPDGYTLLSATPGSYTPALVKDLPFDVLKDFEFISTLYRGALVVFVNPSLQVKTLKDLVDYAKANPGKISYGFPAATGRLAMEMLKISTGTDMTAIPYKSSAQIMNGVLNGDSPVSIDSPLVYRPYIDAYIAERRRSGADSPKPPDSVTSARRQFTMWRTYQMSDHLPLWAEFRVDFADEFLASIR